MDAVARLRHGDQRYRQTASGLVASRTVKKKDLRLALDVKRWEIDKLKMRAVRPHPRRFIKTTPAVEQEWDVSKESKDHTVSRHQVDRFPHRAGRAVKPALKPTRGDR
jgi:hypothetical protein